MTPVNPVPRVPLLGVMAAVFLVVGLAALGAVRASTADVSTTSTVQIVVPEDLDVVSTGRWTLNAFDLANDTAADVAPDVDVEAIIDSSVIELRATGSDADQVEAAIRGMVDAVEGRIEPNSQSYEPTTPNISTTTDQQSVLAALLAHAALGLGLSALLGRRVLDVGTTESTASTMPAARSSRSVGWWIGPLAASALVVGTVAIGAVGLGRAADIALILVFCSALLRLSSRIDALAVVGWAWLLAPLLARLLDWLGDPFDPRPVSLLPLLGSIVLWWRWRGPVMSMLQPRVRVLPAVFLIGMVGAVFGLVDGRWRAEAVGLILWVAPLLVAAVIVASPTDDRDDVTSAVFDWIYGTAIAAAAIAIVQWAVLPPWDEEWIREAVINSVGDPEPRSFRPFGPLNAPAVLGVWLAAGSLIGLLRRNSRLAVGMSIVALIISQQRTSWVALVVALAVVGVTSKAFRQRVVTAVLVLVLAGGIATLVSDQAFDKVQQTVRDLPSDTSLTSRIDAHQRALRTDLWTFTGDGLGSVGVGATAEDGSQRPFDGVLPRSAIRLGGPLTIAYVGLLAGVVLWNRPDRYATKEHLIAWAGAVFCVIAALGTDPLSGSAGIIGWSMIGVLIAPKPDRADWPMT